MASDGSLSRAKSPLSSDAGYLCLSAADWSGLTELCGRPRWLVWLNPVGWVCSVATRVALAPLPKIAKAYIMKSQIPRLPCRGGWTSPIGQPPGRAPGSARGPPGALVPDWCRTGRARMFSDDRHTTRSKTCDGLCVYSARLSCFIPLIIHKNRVARGRPDVATYWSRRDVLLRFLQGSSSTCSSGTCRKAPPPIFWHLALPMRPMPMCRPGLPANAPVPRLGLRTSSSRSSIPNDGSYRQKRIRK